MKKAVVITVLIGAIVIFGFFFEVRPFFYLESTPETQAPRRPSQVELNDILVNCYQQSTNTATAFYFDYEFIRLNTPEGSMTFEITSAEKIGDREVSDQINGQTVNMIYPKHKYKYKYLVTSDSHGEKKTGTGEFEMEHGEEKTITISNITFKLSTRTDHSFWLYHPRDWDVIPVEIGKWISG